MSNDKATTLFVGLDSRKDSISVADAQEGCADPPVFVGSIGTRQAEIGSLVRRLTRRLAVLSRVARRDSRTARSVSPALPHPHHPHPRQEHLVRQALHRASKERNSWKRSSGRGAE